MTHLLRFGLVLALGFFWHGEGKGADDLGNVAQYRWPEQSISRSMMTDLMHQVAVSYHWAPHVPEANLLHVARFDGEFSLYNSLKLWTDIPLLYAYSSAGKSEGSVGNVALGFKGRVYSDLEAYFPYFIYLKLGARLPRTGRSPHTVDRLDYLAEASAKKELERVMLGGHLGYLMKYDGPGRIDYGDEIQAGVTGELEWYEFLALAGGFQYRHSFGFHDGRDTAPVDIPSQSLMIAKLSAIYRPTLGVAFDCSWYQPLRAGSFDQLAQAFGDFITPGLLGPTLFLGLSVAL